MGLLPGSLVNAGEYCNTLTALAREEKMEPDSIFNCQIDENLSIADLVLLAIDETTAIGQRIAAYSVLGKSQDTTAEQQIAFWHILESPEPYLRRFLYSCLILSLQRSRLDRMIGATSPQVLVEILKKEKDPMLLPDAYLVRAELGDMSALPDIKWQQSRLRKMASVLDRARKVLEARGDGDGVAGAG